MSEVYSNEGAVERERPGPSPLLEDQSFLPARQATDPSPLRSTLTKHISVYRDSILTGRLRLPEESALQSSLEQLAGPQQEDL